MNLQNVMALDSQYFMNTFGARFPAVFVKGEGCTLWDQDGKAYVDFLGGIATNALGYHHPALTKALVDTIEAGVLHTSNLFYGEKQALLAQLLCENSCAEKVFIGNSGAEANEGAIKLVRKHFYNKGEARYEIITAMNSFHGRTLATVAATGQPKYQAPYKPLPQGFVNVAYNDIKAIEDAITPHTAAVMIETIQGEGGVVEASAQYLKDVRALCDREGILLILDEVQTGMARTGKLFSYEHFGILPDIFTLAKALGGGMPIGAICARGDCANAFAVGDHGSTFGGNPLACAAGVAVLTTMLKDDLSAAAMQKGAYLKQGLVKLKQDLPYIVDVRGKGLLVGAQLNEKIDGKAVVLAMLEKGFVINCAAGNTLRFVPPLLVTTQQIDQMLAVLSSVLEGM